MILLSKYKHNQISVKNTRIRNFLSKSDYKRIDEPSNLN